jgi:hypothetical protein
VVRSLLCPWSNVLLCPWSIRDIRTRFRLVDIEEFDTPVGPPLRGVHPSLAPVIVDRSHMCIVPPITHRRTASLYPPGLHHPLISFLSLNESFEHLLLTRASIPSLNMRPTGPLGDSPRYAFPIPAGENSASLPQRCPVRRLGHDSTTSSRGLALDTSRRLSDGFNTRFDGSPLF